MSEVNLLNNAGVINEANQILRDFGLDQAVATPEAGEADDFDAASYRRITETSPRVGAGVFGAPQFRGRGAVDVSRLSATLANVEPAVAARVIAQLPADVAGRILANALEEAIQ